MAKARKVARGMPTSKKSREIPDVVDAIVENADQTQKALAIQNGLSDSQISRILARPITKARLRERMAKVTPTQGTIEAIGSILGILGELVDDTIEAGILTIDDVRDMTQLLGALVGTVERLNRAGIDWARVPSADDTRALDSLLGDTYARALRHALQWGPRRTSRALDLLEAKLRRKRM